jgi:hypothetical protein
MPGWPADLPDNFLLEGYSETLADTTIRTQMEAGIAKVRRRFTYAARPFSGRLVVNRAQKESLEAFYITTCRSGADRFEWRHPSRREYVAAQIRFTAPPGFEPLEPEIWHAVLQMEIL